nr:2OG-Fe dioxygenase family protein [Paracoccaceae bacterium]
MKLMQLNQLDKEAIKTVRASFDNLPETDHKDGKYRLRRYSRVELRTTFWNAGEDVEIVDLKVGGFNQSSDYNLHQGNKLRLFENLEEETINSRGFKEICLEFKKANDLEDGVEVDVHQLRVVTLDEFDNTAPVAPEGIHQDGYDYIAMVGIQRNNIKGGELQAYPDKKSLPFLNHILKDGQMLFL